MMQTDTSPSPKTPDEDFYRRGQMRRWGGLLLLVGVVWLVFELTSRGSLFGLGLGFVERSADTPAQSFAAARLVVRGASDNISLERAPAGDTITVAVVRHGFGWNADAAGAAIGRLDVKMTQSGDTLQVEVSRAGFAGFIGRSPYVDLRISVPDGVALDVQTVSGDLRAEGLRADGSLSTTSGDIDLADSSGALQVSSTSGDVQMSGAFAGPQVQTVSGDITLAGASGRLRASSISGDIALRDLRDAQLDLESTSGDIEVAGSLASGQESKVSNISGGVQARLTGAADLRLSASTVSGDLSSDLNLRDAQRERRSLSGTLGAGKTTLTISTTSGDIEVSGR
jgi:hypothetical protein